MAKKSVLALCPVALLAAAFALPASAQVQVAKVDGKWAAHGKFAHVTPAPQVLPQDPVLFSNLGTNPLAVWQANGWLILGATNKVTNAFQYIALPFTPVLNGTARKVEIPVQFYDLGDGATNGFEISIQSDAAGLPGGALAGGGPKQEFAKTTFPACCSAGQTVIASFPGAALVVGTQYWVVVDTIPASDTATEDVWCWSPTAGAYGENFGPNWTAQLGQLPAAKVTGP
jgi:hypothetical protein